MKQIKNFLKVNNIFITQRLLNGNYFNGCMTPKFLIFKIKNGEIEINNETN